MAEQARMSSDLASIDPSVLSWGEYWHPIAWKGLLIAASLAALAAVASVAFLLLLWRTSTIKDHSADWRSTTLQAHAKIADADLLQARKDLADANARTAESQTKAIHATETVSSLEASAAELQQRIATLERERAVTTRALTAADALAASVQAETTHATEKLAKLQADLASAEERIATLGQQLHEAVAARAIENRAVAEANAKAHGLSAKLTALEADAAKAQSRIAALEKETASAKVALAEADGRAIRAEENATQAQKRITELEKEAASTAGTGAGSGRLAASVQTTPEKAKATRSLSAEQQARIAAALKSYAGQEYTLSVNSNSEAENLLCQIDAALRAAKWKRVSSPYSLPIDTTCGTFGLSLLWGVRLRLSDQADTEHQWNMLMLVNALKSEGIGADSSIEADEANSTAISVSVGVQP
jgi:chromosome segregation ATPase